MGSDTVVTDPEQLTPHLREWRDKYIGATNIMVAPSSTEDTSKFVSYCNENRLAIVPQGGNTGLVGGSLPGLDGKPEILFSTKRLSKSLEVDVEDNSIIVDAGVTVAEIQSVAKEHGLMFPLTLASEGSCTAGGITSTNAGGMHVIRYGTTRALTLGIEAVMPDGSIYSDISGLKKDNTGYDLKQNLIGAEGSLGIITKIRFKLVAPETNHLTAWLGAESPEHLLRILTSLRDNVGDTLSVFEILHRDGLEMVIKHIPNARTPISRGAAWHALIEIGTGNNQVNLNALMESWFETALTSGMVVDGALAKSEQERTSFWSLREDMSEAQKHEGGSIKHDISVPVSAIPDFIQRATKKLLETYPGCRPTPFGHMGDGNLHFNIMQPKGGDKQEFLACWDAMNALVHDIVVEFGGSISAEHGIGRMKKAELKRLKPASEIAHMRAIKTALDPNNIMNPGVLFD